MTSLDNLKHWSTKLENLVKRNATDVELKNIMQELGEFAIFTPKIMQGSAIMRARSELDFVGHNQICYEHQISYRNDSENVKRGRCNLNGEAAFYGVLITSQDKGVLASDRLTCASEVSKIDILDHDVSGLEYTTTGMWKITEAFDVVAFCNHEEYAKLNDLSKEMMRNLEATSKKLEISQREKANYIQNYFSLLFGAIKSDYKISSCMASLLFDSGVKGILYPSVQTQGLGINIVLPPSTVDNHLQIIAAQVEKIHKIKKQVVAEPYLNSNNFSDTEQGNRFVWQEGQAVGKIGLQQLLNSGSSVK